MKEIWMCDTQEEVKHWWHTFNLTVYHLRWPICFKWTTTDSCELADVPNFNSEVPMEVR